MMRADKLLPGKPWPAVRRVRAAPDGGGMTQEVLGEADDGKTVRLQVHDQLAIDLHENATTGYRWAFDAADPAIATVQAAAFSGTSGVGAGGRIRWVVTGVAPGETRLHGKLWRHWEGEGSVKQRYAVTVQVQP